MLEILILLVLLLILAVLSGSLVLPMEHHGRFIATVGALCIRLMGLFFVRVVIFIGGTFAIFFLLAEHIPLDVHRKAQNIDTTSTFGLILRCRLLAV